MGPGRTRYSKSFKTRKEAEHFVSKKQTGIRNGRVNPPMKISLQGYHKEHEVLMKGNLANKTLRLHLASIKLLAETVSWNHQLNNVSVRDIERLRSSRFKAGIAPSTANKELKALRRVFNLAISRGYIQKSGNPCNGNPMLKVGSKHQNYVRPEEFHKIYNEAPDCLWRGYLVTLYTTGL